MKFGNEFWLILFREYISPKLFAVNSFQILFSSKFSCVGPSNNHFVEGGKVTEREYVNRGFCILFYYRLIGCWSASRGKLCICTFYTQPWSPQLTCCRQGCWTWQSLPPQLTCCRRGCWTWQSCDHHNWPVVDEDVGHDSHVITTTDLLYTSMLDMKVM